MLGVRFASVFVSFLEHTLEIVSKTRGFITSLGISLHFEAELFKSRCGYIFAIG